jgi:DNA repair exonuclease SbcCD ATPase subunit
LFLELAGLDHLQEYAVHARESANSLESDAHGLTGRISAQEEQLEGLESAKSDLERTRDLLAEAESELAAIESRGQEAKTALESAEKEAESQRRVRERVEELNRRISELVEKLKEQEQEKKRAEAAANLDPDAISQEIAGLEKKGKRLNTLYAKKAEIDEVNARLMREHRKALELANAERQELDRARWQVKEKYDAAEHRLQILAHEIDSLGDRLKQETGDDACPVCGQPWPEHKRAEHEQQLQNLRNKIQEKKRYLEAQTTEANRLEAELKEAVAAVEAHELPAEPKPEPVPFAEELKELKDELEWSDIESKRQQLEAAKQAKSALAEISDTISETESELRATRAQHSSVSQELDPDVEDRVAHARSAYEQTRSDYAQTQHRIGGLKSEAEYGNRKVSELEELGKKLDSERRKRDEMLEKATAWRYLEAA